MLSLDKKSKETRSETADVRELNRPGISGKLLVNFTLTNCLDEITSEQTNLV